ncbi:HAD-IA family hydrolase [Gellertiella hungarica]|uniref:Sugar-phosphatase n=1 Tax=Gellertiella hungarica TaxID=1572859 RepID=A0A7W6J4I3_9HYPH|nr:HAD-IA family hydrolase [Gellertiella hungarica]MBB4063708.1 sugar-phosphatase [Gellertiella hungarica]
MTLDRKQKPMIFNAAFPRSYDAVMFDMDGTLLSSIAVIERVWGRWFTRHGLDPEEWIPRIHGIKAIDVIASLALPGVDARTEALLIEAEEMEDTDGIMQIDGASDFLSTLPADRWAIVTSAPARLARLRIEAAGLPMPAVIVTAEDVERGKPGPACYLLGARKMGVDPSACLVFEDAVAGIAAGSAAGCDVAVIAATHRHAVETDFPRFQDYRGFLAGGGRA